MRFSFCNDVSSIHSFIQAIFCSASSSPLLLRGAPDKARILYRSFTPGNCERRTCPRSLRGGQSGIRTHDPSDERRRSTNEPPCSHNVISLTSRSVYCRAEDGACSVDEEQSCNSRDGR